MKKPDRIAMVVLIIILGSISIWLAIWTGDLKAEVIELQEQPPITTTKTVTTVTGWTVTEPRHYIITETLTETTTEVLRLQVLGETMTTTETTTFTQVLHHTTTKTVAGGE